MKDKTVLVDNYLQNLTEDGLYQLARQLLRYPESRELIEKAMEEFDKFYSYPMRKNEK